MPSPPAKSPDQPSDWLAFRDFAAMNRQALRTAIQRNEFSYLQNVMPVGAGNLQTVRTAALLAYLAQVPTAVKGWSVNLLDSVTLTSGVGNFLAGETVTGGSSGSTGIVTGVTGTSAAPTLQLGNASGAFLTGETITGGSSGAHGLVQSQTSVDWSLISYSDGSLWALSLSSPGSGWTQVAAAATYINDATTWSNTVALLVGPNGYYSWGGHGNIQLISSSQSTQLIGNPLSRMSLGSASTNFIVGETISGGTSHATAKVFYWIASTKTIYFYGASAAFTLGETITGQTSTASGAINTLGPSEPPTVGLVVQQTGSGAVGTISSYNATTGDLFLTSVTGTFIANAPVVDNATGAVVFGPNVVYVSAPPTSGEYVAVYQGRVWVSSGRTVQYSGPNDYTAASWSVVNGAGNFVYTDSTLKGSITRLIVANGYMYIFGATSIDIISNVYVPTGQSPPTPLFTRTNINAVVGSPYPQSIVIYDRLIAFFNQFGIWVLSGVQVERISAKIDRVIQELNLNGPGIVSMGVGMCNNILTLTVLVNWYDPLVSSAASRQTILSYFNGKWFLYDPFGVNPAGTLQCLFPATVNTVPSAMLLYNILGNSQTTARVYECFQSSTDVPIIRTVQTALWDMGLSIMVKQALKVGVEGEVINTAFSLAAQVDSDQTSSDSVMILPNPFTWTTAAGIPFTWTTPSGGTFTWVNSGYAFAYSDVTQYGHYLGITTTGTTGDAIIAGLNMEYKRRPGATWELVQGGVVTSI